MLPDLSAAAKFWNPKYLAFQLKSSTRLSLLLFILSLAAQALHASCACVPDVAFAVKPEWNGNPMSATTQVDVNMGNSLSAFIEAAYWQVYGVSPTAATVATQLNNFNTDPWWRRIDTVNTFFERGFEL